MSKPIGFWGVNYSLELIKDIAECWGDHLQLLSDSDRFWLLGQIADVIWLENAPDSMETSPESEELKMRLPELGKAGIGSFIQALVNKSYCQPLEYWGMPHNCLLTDDIRESWGDDLSGLSELESYYLLGRCGLHMWLRYCDSAPSNEAQEVFDRLDELPTNQWIALCQALGN
ncbi:hypothetical protein NIES4101_74140 [Calothrix sp. NIES-4101]|nr:hypothetical protein NIES4101_74140 [Calothrix sp. NIES-4101]